MHHEVLPVPSPTPAVAVHPCHNHPTSAQSFASTSEPLSLSRHPSTICEYHNVLHLLPNHQGYILLARLHHHLLLLTVMCRRDPVTEDLREREDARVSRHWSIEQGALGTTISPLQIFINNN